MLLSMDVFCHMHTESLCVCVCGRVIYTDVRCLGGVDVLSGRQYVDILLGRVPMLLTDVSRTSENQDILALLRKKPIVFHLMLPLFLWFFPGFSSYVWFRASLFP